MSAITVTPELVSVLRQLRETTEIWDAQGRVLGVFTPQAVAEANRMKSLFDVEEADRILETQRNAGRPLREVWRDVRDQGNKDEEDLRLESSSEFWQMIKERRRETDYVSLDVFKAELEAEQNNCQNKDAGPSA